MVNMYRLRTGAVGFCRSESGSYSAEFAIWTPFLLAMLLLIIDFSYLMVSNASMWNAARNTARAVSIHRVTPDAAEEHLRDALFFDDTPYAVAIETPKDEVAVVVRLDATKVALTPVLGRYVVGTMTARVHMLREPE